MISASVGQSTILTSLFKVSSSTLIASSVSWKMILSGLTRSLAYLTMSAKALSAQSHLALYELLVTDSHTDLNHVLALQQTCAIATQLRFLRSPHSFATSSSEPDTPNLIPPSTPSSWALHTYHSYQTSVFCPTPFPLLISYPFIHMSAPLTGPKYTHHRGTPFAITLSDDTFLLRVRLPE